MASLCISTTKFNFFFSEYETNIQNSCLCGHKGKNKIEGWMVYILFIFNIIIIKITLDVGKKEKKRAVATLLDFDKTYRSKISSRRETITARTWKITFLRILIWSRSKRFSSTTNLNPAAVKNCIIRVKKLDDLLKKFDLWYRYRM
jgi:hypothetical protein